MLLLARRIGGPRGELLLDFVMHPVGRRAFRTELHVLVTLARAVARAAQRRARPAEFSYHRGSSDRCSAGPRPGGRRRARRPRAVALRRAAVGPARDRRALALRVRVAHRLDSRPARLPPPPRQRCPASAPGRVLPSDGAAERHHERRHHTCSAGEAHRAAAQRGHRRIRRRRPVNLRLRLAPPVTVHWAIPSRCPSSSSRSTSQRRSRKRSANASTRSVTTDRLRRGGSLHGTRSECRSLASG